MNMNKATAKAYDRKKVAEYLRMNPSNWLSAAPKVK